MKRSLPSFLATIFLPGLLFCGVLTPAFSVDVSLAALFNYDLVRENGAVLFDQKKVSNLAYVGLIVDVPFTEHEGLFLQNSVKFENIDENQSQGGYNKNIHWDANVLGAFHLAGYDSIFDPYLTGGIGCSGAQFFDDRSQDYRTRTQIVLFPEVGAGINFRIQDFLIGGNIRGQLLSFNPSPLKTYEQFPVALSLNFGVRL